MTKLRDIASAVRSSNAGASLRTFDVIFDREEDFRRVVDANVITPAVVARLYAIDKARTQVFEYAPARAIKVTFPRAVMAGNPEDTDIDGKQQHAPLLGIDVP